tara:strand:+ start:2319 stop:3707 length:1389 start_codon:yes stop_codon:yes gene_type:complete
MIELYFIDWLIIGIYFVIIIWVGIYRSKVKSPSEETFILSGRKLSLPGFVATLVTTWYGGILGVGENTYLYGIQTWFIFGLPYYVFAMIYATWAAPRIQKSKMISIPDHFRFHFGEQSGVISAFLLVLLTSPAPYILSMGVLIQSIFQIELGFSLLFATLFSVVYVWNGGFSAVINTDIIQFIFMFLGFMLLVIFCWGNFGSPISIYESLSAIHKDPLGGNSVQYLFIWFFIAIWTMIDPGFYQRCAAAKSPEIAKKGLFISIGFWLIFDFLTVLSGLYAVMEIKTENPLFAFPLLGLKVLPPAILGIFIVGIFATLMSTIDSFSLISAITFGRDILWRIKKPVSKHNSIPLVKKGLVIISFISLLLAFAIPSVVQLFYTLGSVLIPGLILPFLYTLRTHVSISKETPGNLWIILPVITSMIWLFISFMLHEPFMNIEPFYPGFILSIILGVYFQNIHLKNI